MSKSIEDVKKVVSKMDLVTPAGREFHFKQAGTKSCTFAIAADNFCAILIQNLPELYVHLNKMLNCQGNYDIIFDSKLFFEDLNNQLKEELENSKFSELILEEEKNNAKEKDE